MATDYGLPDEIRIFARLPDGSQLELGTEDRGLTFGTMSPGGDGAIDFGLYATLPYGDRVLPVGTHIELDDAAGAFVAGFVASPGGMFPYRAGDARIQARGYAAACGLRRYIQSTTYFNPTVASAMLLARDDLCVPPLDPTHEYIEPGSLLTRSDGESEDYVGTDALTIWNKYSAIGTTYPDVRPVLWEVLADPHGSGRPVLKVNSLPIFPKYVVRIAAGAVDNPTWNLDDVDNQVIASYLDVLGLPHVIVATDPDITLRFGLTGQQIIKSKAINLSGEMAESDATAWASTTLGRFAKLRVSNAAVNIPWGVAVTDTVTGEDVPLWRVRAGELIRIQIIDTADPTGYLSEEDRFISATSWEGTHYGLTLTTGQYRSETRSAQRRMAERSGAVLGNIPGLSKREGPPLLPRDVEPSKVTYGGSSTPGLSNYPASEAHTHAGPDPTDQVWEQLPIVTVEIKPEPFLIVVSQIQSCTVPIAYACEVTGWVAYADALLTCSVAVGMGPFSSYPTPPFNFVVNFEGMDKGQQHFSTPIPLEAGSYVQFQQNSCDETAATFLTIGLILRRTA